MKRIISLLVFGILSTGCVTMNYTLIPTGTSDVGSLAVSPGLNWNLAPKIHTPVARRESQSWTQDGLNLNRLIVIPAVPDGEPIFKAPQKSSALPNFRAGMLPNELVELAESSIEKLFGEGESMVETDNLRPHRFGEHIGVLFDLRMTLAAGPKYRGMVGSFTAADQLYMIIYLAADPHYFDKYVQEAEWIITNAHLT